MEEGTRAWPVVTVVLCTYNRLSELTLTFSSLVENLQYPRIHWHIADDGSPDNVLNASIHHIGEYANLKGDSFTYSVTQRKGWGANVNYALETLRVNQRPPSDITYFTEDDYVLKRPLDLRPYVSILEAYPQVGMVRFGISGHDGIRARLRELDIAASMPGYSEEVGRGSTWPGKVNVLELELGEQADWGAFGFFRYSNRPHLKHRRFHEAYGKYVEGRTLAETEQAMNHTITSVHRDTGGASPAIIVPCQWTYWYYDHIGKSRQGTEEDVHE